MMKNRQSYKVLKRRVDILNTILDGARSANHIARTIKLSVRQINADLLFLEQAGAVHRGRGHDARRDSQLRCEPTARTQRIRDEYVQQMDVADDFWVPRAWLHPIRAAALGLRRAS